MSSNIIKKHAALTAKNQKIEVVEEEKPRLTLIEINELKTKLEKYQTLISKQKDDEVKQELQKEIDSINEILKNQDEYIEFYSDTIRKSFTWNKTKGTVKIDGEVISEDDMVKLFEIGFKSINDIAKEEGNRYWEDVNEFDYTSPIMKKAV